MFIVPERYSHKRAMLGTSDGYSLIVTPKKNPVVTKEGNEEFFNLLDDILLTAAYSRSYAPYAKANYENFIEEYMDGEVINESGALDYRAVWYSYSKFVKVFEKKWKSIAVNMIFLMGYENAEEKYEEAMQEALRRVDEGIEVCPDESFEEVTSAHQNRMEYKDVREFEEILPKEEARVKKSRKKRELFNKRLMETYF